MPTADTIVVGAGSAGCVLAARLSENPGRRVLLLEAGPDFADAAGLPPDLRSANHPTHALDWGYASEPGALGRPIALPRARVVGGCSATNAAFALRGNPSDYDRWRDVGNPGWGWDDVLPFFRRLENDLDFGDAGYPWHGHDGPIAVRRYPALERTPVQHAFLEACLKAGFGEAPDHNRPGAVGAGPLPVNAVSGLRQSCALTYLAAARSRPNLTIRADVPVDLVTTSGGRATGVRLAGGETIAAGEVVVCAGAYGSPALLLRSGIGPAEHLTSLGIQVVADLAGVGKDLADHPMFPVVFDTPHPPLPGLPSFQAMLTVASSRADAGTLDLQVFPYFTSPAKRGHVPTFALLVTAMQPRSRGSVCLRSADPADPPRIDAGLLADEADIAVLAEGIAIARTVAATPCLDSLVVAERYPGEGDAGRDLRRAIVAATSTCFHPASTCRMGPPADPGAVVDAAGRVHGPEALYVADASVMPALPAANTNLPTIMLAERIAALMTGR